MLKNVLLSSVVAYVSYEAYKKAKKKIRDKRESERLKAWWEGWYDGHKCAEDYYKKQIEQERVIRLIRCNECKIFNRE